MQICIIDYGVGNIRSIYSQLSKNYKVIVSNNKKKILVSDKFILPGVGSANFAIDKINELKLREILYEEVIMKNKPILGICLGMQIFFTKLYENGVSEGLNFKSGSVKKINNRFHNMKVPNIGWGQVNFKNENLKKYIGKFKNFYFCHSYYVDSKESNYLAYLEGTNLPAATLKKNVLGVQFHPENSSVSGELFFKWFVEEFNDF
jgi:glutamine amidotransferase